jgi:hypothetical protein
MRMRRGRAVSSYVMVVVQLSSALSPEPGVEVCRRGVDATGTVYDARRREGSSAAVTG